MQSVFLCPLTPRWQFNWIRKKVRELRRNPCFLMVSVQRKGLWPVRIPQRGSAMMLSVLRPRGSALTLAVFGLRPNSGLYSEHTWKALRNLELSHSQSGQRPRRDRHETRAGRKRLSMRMLYFKPSGVTGLVELLHFIFGTLVFIWLLEIP